MSRRNYKDTLFKAIYGQEKNKKWLLSLYNALSGANCTDEREIEINTIEDIIYVTRKNDVSFLIGTEMYLLEHQSTWNPNLPIRGLMYFAQLYNKRFKQKRKFVFGKRRQKYTDDLYGEKLVKIPAPKFYVLYNGEKPMPDKVVLKLSDAFESPSEGFEWTATVLNVNYDHNKELFEACKSLQDYATYVKMVRDNEKMMTHRAAIDKATDAAIEMDLLDGYFEIHRAEVMRSILTEFNKKNYDWNRRMEGYEDGIIDGAHNAKLETARNFLAMGLSLEQVSKGTGLSLEEVTALQAEMATTV